MEQEKILKIIRGLNTFSPDDILMMCEVYEDELEIVLQELTEAEIIQKVSDEKYVYLYLLTNEKVKQTGIYNIMLKHIACECGLKLEDVEKIIPKMSDIGLIKYWSDENLIYIPKFFKYSKGMIKNPKILLETINRQKELLSNHPIWSIFDEEYSKEIQVINDLLIKNQTNKDNNNNNNNSSNVNNNHNKE